MAGLARSAAPPGEASATVPFASSQLSSSLRTGSSRLNRPPNGRGPRLSCGRSFFSSSSTGHFGSLLLPLLLLLLLPRCRSTCRLSG